MLGALPAAFPVPARAEDPPCDPTGAGFTLSAALA
jgi:hypothetical protein